MVSTSGSRLLSEGAIKNLRERLLPRTTVLTPNIPEALLLLEDCGRPFGEVKSIDDVVNLAKAVQSLGSKNVLVKGGHLPLSESVVSSDGDPEKQVIVNVLAGEHKTETFLTPHINSKNTHGTGCSLACKSGAFVWE